MNFTISTDLLDNATQPYCTHPAHNASARHCKATFWITGMETHKGEGVWMDHPEARCSRHLTEAVEALNARYFAERTKALKAERALLIVQGTERVAPVGNASPIPAPCTPN